jgi:nucleotide-binding universal stress UspA family protein
MFSDLSESADSHKGASMFEKILVALDDTVLATKILDEAMLMADRLAAKLMLLHVLSPIETERLGMKPGGIGIESFFPILNEQAMRQYALEWQAYEEHGMAQLQGHARMAQERGLTVEYEQMMGDPGQSICKLAQTWGAGLILLGRNRKSGISELFLGSTSNYVLHHAPCSVLAIQAPLPVKVSTPESIT